MMQQKLIDSKFSRLVEADNNNGAALGTKDQLKLIVSEWGNVKSEQLDWTPDESYRAQVALVADLNMLVTHVANRSGLILDPQLDSYYLMDLIVNNMPDLIEAMGQARAIAAGAAVNGKLEYYDRGELMIRLDRIRSAENKLKSNLLIIYQERPSLREKLARHGILASNSAESFYQLIDNELIYAESITLSAHEIFESSTIAIDNVFVSYDQIIPELNAIFSERIVKETLNKNIALLMIVGVVLLVLFVSIGFYKALNRFKNTLDLTKDSVCSIEPEKLKITYVNLAAIKLLGYSEAELLQMSPIDLGPDLDEGKMRRMIAPLLAGTQNSISFESQFKHKNGGLVPVEIVLEYINPRGEQGRILAVVRDISERIKMRDKVNIYSESARDVQQRFNLAVEGAGDGAWDWDLESNVLTYSRLWMEMLGYQERELPHNMDTFTYLVHPDDLENVQKHIYDYLAGKISDYTIEMRMLCKDGHYKWILSRGKIVDRNDTGVPSRMTGIHSDITRKKQVEDELRIFRRIFDSSGQGIGVTDAQGHFLYANKAHDEIIGAPFEEIVGKSISSLMSKETGQMINGVIQTMFKEGKGWSGILPVVKPDGSEIVTASNIGFIVDNAGAPQYLFNILSDYSEELQRQQQLTSAKEDAEKANLAKSEFLSSMSHELRTPMNAILGFSQLMEYDDTLSDDSRDSVDEILKAGNHLLSLINEVLDLAKVESGSIDMSFEAVDVRTVINECINLISTQAEKLEVKINYSGIEGVIVRADRTRLKQVLLNLLSNAVKYNRKGGEVKIGLELKPVDENIVCIHVTDTGLGIPSGRLEELFKPFNRLEAENSDIEGTGIGLTITRRIVEMMGGIVGVDSEIGVGSHFWIELPADSLSESVIETSGSFLKGEVSAQNADEITHTVLYVEDNPSNLRLVAQLFSKYKHIHLLTAHTPELGIELARSREPDLILLDINMPGMDGYQVLEVLKACENLRFTPIVAVTANAMPGDIERGKEAGFIEYLTKPLDVEKFYQVIEQVLNRKQNVSTSS